MGKFFVYLTCYCLSSFFFSLFWFRISQFLEIIQLG